MEEMASKLAGVEQLQPFFYLGIPDVFAQRFSMDPDEVYHKPFNMIINFMWRWHEQGEYQKRFAKAMEEIRKQSK